MQPHTSSVVYLHQFTSDHLNMRLLVLVLVLSLVSLNYSAVVNTSLQRQLFDLNSQLDILHQLLAKECPGYLQEKRDVSHLPSLELEILKTQVQRLKQQLIECRTEKLQHKSTPVAATKLVPTSTLSSSTTQTSLCPSYDGISILNIQLISYSNPTNKQASGGLCSSDGSPCNIFLEICVSPLGSSSCEFYHHVTDVVGDKSKINLLDNPGNLTNPVNINLGDRKWQGANVHIAVLARNSANSLRVYHEVDEFSYELTDAQGSPHRLLTLHGQRAVDKTELTVMLTVPCPSPSTTLPTFSTTLLTASSTLPTTTPSSTPAECLTATNLTQSWRLDHNGSDIKPSEPHSLFGYACDLHEDLGWFRFTGAAGTHMLDKCPEYHSCGASYPYWTDETPPQAVGVTANIYSYGVSGDDCRDYGLPLQVMRCSWTSDHDLIYKYVGIYYDFCNHAFCGMN